MSKMEQELNKKLAEWAVFRLLYKDIEDRKSWYWVQPNGQTQAIREPLPAFPYSLDACFKWLVPKLPLQEIYIQPTSDNSWQVDIEREEYWADAETPALALCLAIEKLIDGTK